MERGGWLPPKPQVTKSMVVTGGGFIADIKTKSLKLTVSLHLNSIPESARFIRVTFPDGQTKARRETRVLPITSKKDYDATSSPMSNLKYYDSYPVLIQVTSDSSGAQVIEEMTQFVRFELPPAIQAQLGISN